MSTLPAVGNGPAETSDVGRRCDRWVLVIVLLGAVLRFAMLAKPVAEGDIQRFEAEALSLLSGHGFALDADGAERYFGTHEPMLVTEHPPGYAIVVALLYSVREDRRLLLLANWLMGTAAIYLVYLAVRPAHCRAGVAAAALLAFNPWLIRWTSYLMSETFGAFLVCLLILQLSRVQRQVAGAWGAFWVGVLCVALLLTVPATVFLDALVVIATAWQFRRRPGPIVALAAGCLLLMVPWQIHCVYATGRVQPVLRPIDTGQNFTAWVNTWQDDADQIHVYWGADYIDQLPDNLFANTHERAVLKQAAIDRRSHAGRRYGPSEQAFGEAARRRQAELSPWKYHVVLPFWRAVTMWTDYQQLLWREGWQARVVHIVLLLLNWFYLAVFLALCAFGLRSRQPLAWAIVMGVLLFTVYNGYVGCMEYRRIYPFYPALLFLFYYWPAGCCPSRGAEQSKQAAA